MADDSDKAGAENSAKVAPMPSDLLRFTRLVAQSLRAADRDQLSTGDPHDDGPRPEPLQAKTARESQIEAHVEKHGESDVMEALIGLGLILVGLAAMIVVFFLPRRAATPAFVAIALIIVGAGGWRIDKATRSHRAARRAARSQKRRP